MFAIFSILDNLSHDLLRPEQSEANLCFNELYENGTRLIRGFRGGKHAAKRPIETSAVVQKVGGVAKPLVLPVKGSKETVQCQCSYFGKGTAFQTTLGRLPANSFVTYTNRTMPKTSDLFIYHVSIRTILVASV